MSNLNEAVEAFNALAAIKTEETLPHLKVIQSYLIEEQGRERRRGTSFEYLDREAEIVERLKQLGL